MDKAFEFYDRELIRQAKNLINDGFIALAFYLIVSELDEKAANFIECLEASGTDCSELKSLYQAYME